MPTRRLIGGHLAEKYPDRYPGPAVPRVHGPCPVCRRMDCRMEEEHMEGKIIGRPGPRGPSTRTTDRRSEAEAVPEGFTQHPKDPELVVAADDIYIDHYPKGTKRASTILLFAKGSALTRQAVNERRSVYRLAPLETKDA